MADDSLKELEVRLERIEKVIETLPKAKRAALSDEDVAAYHRVRTALWEDGTCGINETSPCVIACRVCQVTPIPIPRPCDVECTCGPCNVFTDIGGLRGGLQRFGTLGF